MSISTLEAPISTGLRNSALNRNRGGWCIRCRKYGHYEGSDTCDNCHGDDVSAVVDFEDEAYEFECADHFGY